MLSYEDYLLLESAIKDAIEDQGGMANPLSGGVEELLRRWIGASSSQIYPYFKRSYLQSMLKDKQALISHCALVEKHRVSEERIARVKSVPQERQTVRRIEYSIEDCPFGRILVASTCKGVCFLMFDNDTDTALRCLQEQFPQSSLALSGSDVHRQTVRSIEEGGESINHVPLHLFGTSWQHTVWNVLLDTRYGSLTSYGGIARLLGNPNAARAVGSAVARNTVAYLVPCHRVVPETGDWGGFRWGRARKASMIAWEAFHSAADQF